MSQKSPWLPRLARRDQNLAGPGSHFSFQTHSWLQGLYFEYANETQIFSISILASGYPQKFVFRMNGWSRTNRWVFNTKVFNPFLQFLSPLNEMPLTILRMVKEMDGAVDEILLFSQHQEISWGGVVAVGHLVVGSKSSRGSGVEGCRVWWHTQKGINPRWSFHHSWRLAVLETFCLASPEEYPPELSTLNQWMINSWSGKNSKNNFLSLQIPSNSQKLQKNCFGLIG
jgi:hypothetical protein